jgi:hypothetical protein
MLLLIITLKLSLGSAGIIPTLNVPAGLLSYVMMKIWVSLSAALPWSKVLPFTLQENAVIQTMVMACSNVGFTGGFG